MKKAKEKHGKETISEIFGISAIYSNSYENK
jgi:hypothetical protein